MWILSLISLSNIGDFTLKKYETSHWVWVSEHFSIVLYFLLLYICPTVIQEWTIIHVSYVGFALHSFTVCRFRVTVVFMQGK